MFEAALLACGSTSDGIRDPRTACKSTSLVMRLVDECQTQRVLLFDLPEQTRRRNQSLWTDAHGWSQLRRDIQSDERRMNVLQQTW